MNPSDTTPANEPAPSPDAPEQSTQPQMPPMPEKGKSKKPLIIAAIIVVLLAGAAVAYYATRGDKPIYGSSNKQSAQTAPTAKQSNQEAASTLVTGSLSNNDKDYGSGKISVTYPKSWKVKTGTDSDGANQLEVTSAKGNVLRITQQIGGVGGTCEPDNDSYTLVKKINTATSGYAFTEYTTTSPIYKTHTLSIESYAHAKDAHKALKEGGTNTDICGNIGFLYPIVDGMFVHIYGTDGKAASYDQVKDDADFLTMLASFTVSPL